MRVLANDPRVPYEEDISLAGPEVYPEHLEEVHARLMKIAAVSDDAAEIVPRHKIPGVESYFCLGFLQWLI
jgi:hypothetical protein